MIMNGKALIVALSILAAAATAADAATKKKDANPPAQPAVQATEPAPAPPATAPYECWTDEGYGRRLPCSMGK
jgi:hypothetical protein